jgi:hypothetical protein
MKEYIGNQEHFEDEVNAFYDQKVAYEKDMKQEFEKDMLNQLDPTLEEWYEYLEKLNNEK